MKLVEPLVCGLNNQYLLNGDTIEMKVKHLGELQGVYAHSIPKERFDEIAYQVALDKPKKEAVEGTLQFGVSMLNPYTIEGEFSCTKGHFHADLEYDEYYFGYEGEGFLLFWDGLEEWFAQRVFPGSIHHIDGKYAHRLINTSMSEILKVGACWNALAGYNYGAIEEKGFPVRCFLEDGQPVWKEQKGR
jgi:glucose-6-phosphate isomerase